MLEWGKPKWVITPSGERMLQVAKPTNAFWDAWRTDKQALTSQGISVGKNKKSNEWEVCRWSLPTVYENEERKIHLKASRDAGKPHDGREPITDGVALYGVHEGNAGPSGRTMEVPQSYTMEHWHIPCRAGMAYLPFQLAGIRYALARNHTLIADEMGCLSGTTELRINRAGRGFQITLEQLYIKFNGVHIRGNDRWDNSIPTRIKALCDEELRLHTIRAVVFRGHKETWRVTLASGKQLQATPDHEIATPNGYVALEALTIGSPVLTNGKPICRICGGDHHVTRYRYARFKGYCYTCIHRHLLPKRSGGRFVDQDGYVRLSGHHEHPRAKLGQVYEHLVVMEHSLGRFINYPNEHVHHINGIRSDNRLENLQLVTQVEHHAIHKKHRHLSRDKHGNEIAWIPRIDTIIRIEIAEVEPVYDIVMDDPHRNFVANGIIVHNCGKTIQVCGIINALYTDPAKKLNILIVCPASLRLNWKRELEKWLVHPRSIGIIDSGFFPTNEILIINYDRLARHQSRLIDRGFDLLVADECHYIKNEKAQRTKALLKLQTKRSVYLTGTPILNRPIELFTLLTKLDPGGLGRSRWAYAKRYCNARRTHFGIDMSGASNLSELQRNLRETIMVRRLKADVLAELPAKRRQVIELPLNGAKTGNLVAEERKIYLSHGERMAELHAARARAKASGNEESYRAAVDALRSAQGVMFSEMAKVRHELALLKVPYLIEHIRDSLEGGPIVCFVHHKDVAEAIANSFAERSALYHGDTPMKERQAIVDRFQDPNSSMDLFVGTIQAAGVGLTLTRSSHVIFGELSWTSSALQQAEDRTHRIGQRASVLIQHIVFDSSLDATMAKTLVKKMEVINEALDAELDNTPRPTIPERAEIVYPKVATPDNNTPRGRFRL